jgi:hypothetical protein
VPDEYINRYQSYSHEELWKDLKAGDPNQVDTLAAAWKSLHDTASGLATSLNQDLAKLTAGWSSSSGTEYQRRVGLIGSFSSAMAGEFDSLYRGLSLMSGPLRTAQKQAEDPAATDDHDNTIKDALIGFAVAGPPGGIIGGLFGNEQDKEEKEKAHQRMVQLVANLAADYTVARTGSWSTQAPVEPTDLPGDTTGGRYDAAGGPQVRSPGSVTGTHSAYATTSTVNDPNAPSRGPQDGVGSADGSGATLGPDGKPIDVNTGLAGDGTLAGAGALGLTGLTTSLLAAGGGAPGAGSGYPLGGAAGAGGLHVGNPLSGAAGEGGVRDPRAAAGTRANAARQAASAGRGHGEQGDEADERTTWLTEDDIVWGTEEAPPGVLGGRPADEPDESSE